MITGDMQFSDWQTYTGAIVGGAIGGVAALYVGPVAAAAIGSGSSTYIGESLQYLTGSENAKDNMGEILLDTAASATVGAVLSKVPHVNTKHPTTYFAGQSYSSGLWTCGYLSNLSSLPQTIRTVSSSPVIRDNVRKTFVNGVISETANSVEESVYGSVLGVVNKALNLPPKDLDGLTNW